MKKMFVCVAVLLLILCCCKKQPADNVDPTATLKPSETITQIITTRSPENVIPTDNIKPSESVTTPQGIEPSATTVTVTPTVTITPTVTTVPTVVATEPTVVKNLAVSDWQLEQPAYLSYEEYISVEREFERGMWIQSKVKWIKGANVYSVKKLNDSLTVNCENTQSLYRVPNSATYTGYEIIGADGRYCYLYNTKEFLRMNLASGETELLLDRMNNVHYQWGSLFLCDNLVVYYFTYADNELTVGRLYLPTLRNDILYKSQGKFYDLVLERPQTNQVPVVWRLKNPDFIAYLKTELKNPSSKYQTIEQYDYSEFWEKENGLEAILKVPLLLHNIQDDCGIRALLQCSVDPLTKELTQKTGIMDNCFHGSDFNHDHYNPEITTAPSPDVIMGQWKGVNWEGLFELIPTTSSQKTDVNCVLVTGVDSCEYVYTNVCGAYRKCIDAPVNYLYNTGSCIITASADKKAVFATSYDGKHSSVIYQAVHGEISGWTYYSYDDSVGQLLVWDGDVLVEIDLVNMRHRELLRQPYVWSYYMDSDTKIYFDVRVGLYVAGYTLNTDNGELKKGYRL